MSCKYTFNGISLNTSLMKYYNAFLYPVITFLNPTSKISDSACYVAFCINGPACSAKMGFACSSTIFRIALFNSGLVDRSKMDGLTFGAGPRSVAILNRLPWASDPRTASRQSSRSSMDSFLSSDWLRCGSTDLRGDDAKGYKINLVTRALYKRRWCTRETKVNKEWMVGRPFTKCP